MTSMQGMLKSFLPFAKKTMGFAKPVTITFQSDDGNAQKLLGKTAHYDPTTNHVVIYVTGRHPKDVMRSLSHELVHHAQNCRGEFGNTPATTPGYAQKDNHLRKMEEEAYKVGNLCFRDWEDGVKTGNIKVSTMIKESLLKEEREHTIESGETISSIAGIYYDGDIHAWPIIYKTNQSKIGGSPDLVEPGTVLSIPSEDTMSLEEKNKYYAMSDFYEERDGVFYAVAKGEVGLGDIEDLKGLTIDDFKSTGSPSEDAKAELQKWGNKKEGDPDVQNRLSAMWQWCGRNIQPGDANAYSQNRPWSAVTISWFFRSDPDFPRSTAHYNYIKAAESNRETSGWRGGYLLFEPEELEKKYQENDIICYQGSDAYRGFHCDLYIGDGQCIGGNLGNTVTKRPVQKNVKYVIRKVNAADVLKNWFKNLFGEDKKPLQEWKNDELNRLLLEKFNLGVKK